MSLIDDTLKEKGVSAWSLKVASMEADELSMEFAQVDGVTVAHGYSVGDEVTVGAFWGKVWDIQDSKDAGGAPTTQVTARGLIAVLDTIPCLLLDGLRQAMLPIPEEEGPRLVSLAEVVQACDLSARQAGLSVRYVGDLQRIMMPDVSGVFSVWGVLRDALKWCPCVRTTCIGKVLTVYGYESEPSGTTPSVLTYSGKTANSQTLSFDELPPPVVAARGGQNFEFPAGANIYQPGAFVYQVPEDEANAPQEPGYGSAGTREAGHERNGQWMLLRGIPIPSGLLDVSASARAQMLSPVANQSAWLDFWAQCGMAQTFSLLDATRFTFGSPVLSVQPGSVAYPAPPTPQTFPQGGKLGPMVEETNTVPANYHEFKAANAFYVLSEGSFPASTNAAGNVKGLTFCKGRIEQYVWLKGEAKNDEEASFFDGATIVNSNGTMKQKRYTVLKLETIFVNRRYKRFQTGTNKLAPGDEDYGSGDALVNAMQEEQEAWKADLRDALEAYYKATRAVQPSQTVTLFDVAGFEPGTTTLQEAFTACGLAGTAGSMTWDEGARRLTVNNSRTEVLGVDDYIQRAQIARRQRQNELNNACMGVSSAGIVPNGQREPEDTGASSMVAPSLNATHAAGNVPSKKTPKWTLFCVGTTWYLNGGSVGMGSKTVRVGVTPYMWTGGQPDATQTWGDPANGKPRIRRRKGADGKLTFDLYQA